MRLVHDTTVVSLLVGMVTRTFYHNIVTLINDYLILSYLILSLHSDYLAEQLYWASVYGRDQEVLELLQRGAPLNSDYYTREHGGRTPLHKACINKHLCSAKLLIKFGAIVAATTDDDYTPLHGAYRYDSEDTAKLLLEHHCPPREPGC